MRPLTVSFTFPIKLLLKTLFFENRFESNKRQKWLGTVTVRGAARFMFKQTVKV